MCVDGNQGDRPNYDSSVRPLRYEAKTTTHAMHERAAAGAEIDNLLTQVTDADYEQPRALWERVFDEGAKKRFVHNVAGHLGNVNVDMIKERTLQMFARVHPDIRKGIEAEWKA